MKNVVFYSRYKKDITRLPNALSNVLKLEGVNYFWKTNEFPERQFTTDRQIGFIAQELEKIYPEMVFTDDKGYKSVDYSRLTPVLVEALKELNSKNEMQQKMLDKQQQLSNEQQKINKELQVKNEMLESDIKKIKQLLEKEAKK